jgi:hypothetical protein
MAVTPQTGTLPVNPIGGSPRRGKAARPLFRVYNPKTGETQTVERHVRNDMVGHLGWLDLPADTKPAPAPVTSYQPVPVDVRVDSVNRSEMPVTLDPVSGNIDPAVKTALGELEKLRTEARELGIDVDQRWGLKTLNARIAAALQKDSSADAPTSDAEAQ